MRDLPDQPSRSRPRVLLIEDDRDIADMYALRLAHEGFDVSLAEDGDQGCSLALAQPPDLVYLDLRLPVMDGFEVLKRLRQEGATSGIPIVILTNYGEDDLRLRGFELGATGFLVKASTTPQELVRLTAEFTGTAVEEPSERAEDPTSA